MTKHSVICGTSLTDAHAKLLIKLKANGYFPSKSAVVRYCISYTIPKLMKETKLLNEFIKNQDVINVIKKLREFGYIIYRGQQKTKHIPILSINSDGKNVIIQ